MGLSERVGSPELMWWPESMDRVRPCRRQNPWHPRGALWCALQPICVRTPTGYRLNAAARATHSALNGRVSRWTCPNRAEEGTPSSWQVLCSALHSTRNGLLPTHYAERSTARIMPSPPPPHTTRNTPTRRVLNARVPAGRAQATHSNLPNRHCLQAQAACTKPNLMCKMSCV